MNRNYDLNDYKFPQIKAVPWKKAIKSSQLDDAAVSFIDGLLTYSPVKRMKPLEALQHLYFDELRDQKKLMALKMQIQVPDDLFDFNGSKFYFYTFFQWAPQLRKSKN